MLKKMLGKIHLNKSLGESHVTVHAVRQCEPVRFTREIKKSLTTLDTIALVALIMCLHGLSVGTLTELDNRNDHKE
jgi:hypothetical protein